MVYTGKASTTRHLADEHCKDAIIELLPNISSEAIVSRLVSQICLSQEKVKEHRQYFNSFIVELGGTFSVVTGMQVFPSSPVPLYSVPNSIQYPHVGGTAPPNH